MGVRNTATEGKAALFDSVTGRAFGPTFDEPPELDDFMDWYHHESPHDVALNKLSEADIDTFITEWRAVRAQQEREEANAG